MVDRIVLRVNRDQNGNTIMLAGEGWQRDGRWAIQDIVEDRHAYFTLGTGGVPRRVWVVNGPSGLYLRASADSLTENNLDTLPEFQPNPWEVALEDTEILAVHAALVTHGEEGQIVMFGGNEHDPGNADAGEFFNTRIYDVARNRMININSPEADVFCCDHAFLADGRLFIGGGTESWRGPHEDAHMNPRPHWDGARECGRYNLDGTWTAMAAMQFEPGREDEAVGGGRWYPTLLTLADGRILAMGGHPNLTDGRHGAWLPEVYEPGTDSWSYQPGHWMYVEIYTPGIDWQAGQVTFTEERWAPTPEANVPRNYHSIALLLANGRVLTAGSNRDGQSGGDSMKEYRVEIYTPEWFHDVNRPLIRAAPGSLGYDVSFDINCTRAGQIQRAALMRCGSVTHAWDGDQRHVGLDFTQLDDGLRLTAPPDGSVVPPGPYMLWVVDFDGRPCRLAPFVILN